LTHPRQNKAQTKSANHQSKAWTTTKSFPCTHQAPPEPMHLPNAPHPRQMHANQLKTGQLQQLQLTPVRPVNTTCQTGA
jgi:hypothetical protein